MCHFALAVRVFYWDNVLCVISYGRAPSSCEIMTCKAFGLLIKPM